ncbi:hypothetical protein RWE87_05085 [Sinorhizobium meliloti]|nr:hypothetical protein [Sinorhizobium meliloti]
MKNPSRYLDDTTVRFHAFLAWEREGVWFSYPDGNGGYANFTQETLGL